MKEIKKNVPHTMGDGVQCKRRYHDLRTPTTEYGKVTTESAAKLYNRCNLGGVLNCRHPKDNERTCHFTRR